MSNKKGSNNSKTEVADKRFKDIDDAILFLNQNNVTSMTVKEMMDKMSEGQKIQFAEFLYYM